MNDKVKKMYKTRQEYRNAVTEYKDEIRDFFKDEVSIYNLSVKVYYCNKLNIQFDCDANLDSNHILDFCERFGLNKTIWMDRIDNGYTKTYSYKFCKNISSKEVI